MAENLPKFSIYYADGSRYDGGGDDDEVVTLEVSKRWLEAPSDGVLAVVVADEKLNKCVLSDKDFYYGFPLNHHAQGTQGAANSLGPYLRQVGLVKFGGWTNTVVFEQAKVRAIHDDDWLPSAAVPTYDVEDPSAED